MWEGCCSQAHLLNNISDTYGTPAAIHGHCAWEKPTGTSFFIFMTGIGWGWCPCPAPQPGPCLRSDILGRNPTVTRVSFGPACHLSCGAVALLLSYYLHCSAQGLHLPLSVGSCWTLVAREGEGERCQEQQKMERDSFPEEPPRQEPRARMLCKGCCCVMGTWTVSCGCQGCSECPQPSPLQGCCSLWDTQAFNYPNYTCTIHGRQRNNSGSCRIFLKILSYLKIILNQTNGWGQQCYEQNSIGAGAQKPCVLKASSSSVAGRGGQSQLVFLRCLDSASQVLREKVSWVEKQIPFHTHKDVSQIV